jgi:hypothetical protein
MGVLETCRRRNTVGCRATNRQCGRLKGPSSCELCGVGSAEEGGGQKQEQKRG